MALPASKWLLRKLFFSYPSIPPPRISNRCCSVAKGLSFNCKSRKGKDEKQKSELLKRRTRSERELDEEWFSEKFGNGNTAHVPVMLGEVLDVFASVPLKSFVDCTLGAGGHSAAIIQAHPEMELYVGLDVDPVAHKTAQSQLSTIFNKKLNPSFQVHMLLKNFKYIKSVLHEIGGNHEASGVYGIFMDLGVSSMQVDNVERGFSVLKDGPLDMRMNPQASLKAEDIINTWSAAEIGRILRDYGEESNWFSLQNKFIRARSAGSLHSTGELVDLIRGSTHSSRGGRQGWIKTATRVFQALRIAVNDELNVLKDSIHSSFSCLAPGGRLVVISFHSLEDRIVKQAFLDIVGRSDSNAGCETTLLTELQKPGPSREEQQPWRKHVISGRNARILTKRPVTPSESEERLNPRSRSAKLRVIEKI